MGWFETVKNPKLKSVKKASAAVPSTLEGLWKKCIACKEILQSSKLSENEEVCPYCDHHYRMTSMGRINLLLDKDSFKEYGAKMESSNPLDFFDRKKYSKRLEAAKASTNMYDSSRVGLGTMGGREISIAAMDFKFMGGSMGVVTGEKMAYCLDQAYEKRIPAIIVSCSGGARMQEGILSLMQMAKISASRQKLSQIGVPFFSILTDPTTGGVAASFAMQGDLNLAEPNALIGFAGPRVIEQSIRQKLPEGFQRSEFLLEHGMIDQIVHRNELRKRLMYFYEMFMPEAQYAKKKRRNKNSKVDAK